MPQFYLYLFRNFENVLNNDCNQCTFSPIVNKCSLFSTFSSNFICYLCDNRHLIVVLICTYLTTRLFRYDLNPIPYDYTVDVRNRLKGLDLIDKCLMNYGQRFMTLYRRQGSRPSPWKRNAKRQNGCLRRPYK